MSADYNGPKIIARFGDYNTFGTGTSKIEVHTELATIKTTVVKNCGFSS